MQSSRDLARIALQFLAILSLVLNGLLPGSASTGLGGAGTPASNAQLHCPERAPVPAPEDHRQSRHDACSCCVLCGNPGVAFNGAASTPPLASSIVAVLIIPFHKGDLPAAGSASTLPVGARAPPLLG